ncbi:IS110 family transposase [Gordonia polyisoprenivorans]|jgi:transposase|uniref:IS110 family transposase n=1 Tax=Gordonia polyisoprenivorans TaxID=84595 RepID=UPI001B8BD9CA|nr:IS110 family transposase [Gordonia polyisoprenivorans]QUD85457.1 IS110 family transposase [Gordonia polyisoprenivorans]QUD85712.1 IS110 family transposase [Gordonia polyisoprenivorans]
MEVIHARCAGIDISKRDAKVCIRVQGKGRRATKTTITTWGAMTREILALRDYLIEQEVTCVVMESTGSYWKPFYYVLEDSLNAMLVNAHESRNRPGRKTDVSDAAWLADLAAHGLLRASFVPPPPIRRLRDLTRERACLTQDRTREIHRLEKVLEDAGIKLGAVASDLMGQSCRAMLAALVSGSTDTQAMADLAQTTMRPKIPILTEALIGRFTAHHAYLVQLHLTLIDSMTTAMADIETRIDDELTAELAAARELLSSIPGWSASVAEVFLAETGGDMTIFPTPGHLASWAGVCPGSNESAGKIKSTTTRDGNRHLKRALGVAAMSASRTKNTYYAARYRRLTARRGPMRALVALQRSMIVAAYTMLTTHALYIDPGGDYYTVRKPNAAKNHAIHQLEALGYSVMLNRTETT